VAALSNSVAQYGRAFGHETIAPAQIAVAHVPVGLDARVVAIRYWDDLRHGR